MAKMNTPHLAHLPGGVQRFAIFIRVLMQGYVKRINLQAVLFRRGM